MNRLLRWVALGACAALLSGCAGTYLLENRVQSFAGTPAIAGTPSYRFERLPSQQSDLQAQLEAMADPALFRAGFRRDDAQPRYSVQVSARVQRTLSPWADPWDGFGPAWGFGLGYGGAGFGFGGPFPRMEAPWYRREVGIVVRELAANRVVYETHAQSEGPWPDSSSVLPVMFDAALQGFPNPPPGPRRVDVQVGAR